MSDEARLNRIEEKLDSVVRESSELRGEIRQFMGNSASYTAAVSVKAASVGVECDRKTEVVRAALDAHRTDPEAHGEGVRQRMDGKFWTMMTAIGGFSGLIGAFFHHVMSGSGGHAP